MALEIRPIEHQDLEQLYILFGKRKDRELLQWLYGHPCADGRSAFVALEDGQIVGAVGFVRTTYLVQGKVMKGLIPLSWEVVPEKRGLAGIRLLYTALKGADFYLGMDGSEDMKMIFGKLQFSRIGTAVSVRKVLKPWKYLKTLEKKGFKDIWRFFVDAFRSFARRSVPVDERGIICEVDKSGAYRRPVSPAEFYNLVDEDHLRWLLSCPFVESHVFTAMVNGIEYFPVICFIKTTDKGSRRGQIVHIPPLPGADHAILRNMIRELEDFFLRKDVYSVTSLVTGEQLTRAFRSLGYRFARRIRPVVIKGPAETVEAIKNSAIHLSFAETDKSVRNF